MPVIKRFISADRRSVGHYCPLAAQSVPHFYKTRPGEDDELDGEIGDREKSLVRFDDLSSRNVPHDDPSVERGSE